LFIVSVDVAKKALEATLVFWTGFMLGLLEWRVANEDLALFAPDARLQGRGKLAIPVIWGIRE
jgi:hypothetical protein